MYTNGKFTDVEPFLYEPCGTMHIQQLDGRKSLSNLKHDSFEWLSIQKKFNKKNTSFMLVNKITDNFDKALFVYNPEKLVIKEI